MSIKATQWMALVALAMLSFSGCGQSKSGASQVDADVAELDLDLAKSDHEPNLTPTIATPPVPVSPPASQEGTLELKLTVNEPFPLSKTVEQRLTEADQSGVIGESTSRTDMMMSLNVDEILPDGRKKLTVRYHKVRYEQVVRGVRTEYSSEKPTETVPRSALVYAGLANNGFSFVVGPNNKVIELIGFNDFLQRCLKNVPTHEAASVRQQLEAVRSEDGIAAFVDDSIGLLPYSDDPQHPGVSVREGSQWRLERRSEGPLPTYMTTICTLNDLSQNSAEILMAGQISGPPKPISMRVSDGEMRIQIKGGNCTGSCRVDRRTGLPTQSRIQRYLELAMELPNGNKINQTKETLSTITSFLGAPVQQASFQQVPNGTGAVNQVNFQNANGAEQHRQVQQAGGPQQAR